MEHVPSALAQQQAAEAAEAERIANGEEIDEEEEEEEHEGGLDPEIATERFEEVRALLVKTEKSIAAKGRDDATTIKNIQELGETFKYLKLTPRQFDPLVSLIRASVDEIRTQ
jgi:RNA polymerase primary sigma factor